jgi:hypothetical protein
MTDRDWILRSGTLCLSAGRGRTKRRRDRASASPLCAISQALWRRNQARRLASGWSSCAAVTATRLIGSKAARALRVSRSITTTMRYAHFAPQHATQSIREVQKREAESFASAQEKNRRQDSEGETENAISSCNPLIALMPKRGLEPPPPCED